MESRFKSKAIKTFLVSLTLTFLMAAIPHFNIKQIWVSPLPKTVKTLEDSSENTLNKIKPLLEKKANSFHLKRQLVSPVYAGSDFEKASAYAVVDFDTGQIIASKNFSTRLPMASLTKIMTAAVALDLAKPDEEFTVSKRATFEVPSKMMLKEGEKYTLDKLLRFALISSANDSAQVIKEGIDQKLGQGVFIKAMNLKAQILGLKNTHFTNPQGYDNINHFSSVEDLSILSNYVLKEYPEITEIVSKEFEDLTKGGQDLRFYLNNWNGLIGVYPGTIGVKIGNTGKALHCTSVVSKRGSKKLLAVVLGAPGVLERDLWAGELLDLGFSQIAGLPPVNVSEQQFKQKYASWKYFE